MKNSKLFVVRIHPDYNDARQVIAEVAFAKKRAMAIDSH